MSKEKKVKEEKTQWQKDVEASLNQLAKVCYSPALLEINKKDK